MTRSTKVVSKTITGAVTLTSARKADRGLDTVSGAHVVTLARWQAQEGLKDRAASIVLRGDDSAKARLSNIRNAYKVAGEAFPDATGATFADVVGLMYGATNDNRNRLTVAKHEWLVTYVLADSTKGNALTKARAAIAALPSTVKAKAPKAPTVDHSPKDGDSEESADDNGDPLASNRETKQVATVADAINIVTRWLNSESTSPAEVARHGAVLESLALALSAREVVA